MRRLSDALVGALVAAVAAWFVLFCLSARGMPLAPAGRPGMLVDGRQPAHDVYAYFYPNLLYALRTLRDGGRGLLWNPYQNCGQPFFGVSGILYPTNLLFLFLNADLALRGALFVNMLVAGVFAYLLCREFGARRSAALAGALAFELGTATVTLTAWAPFMNAPYVWLPAAMLFTAKLLRHPTLRAGLGLGVVSAVALLPDYPQTVFFTYQLIGLRVVWELMTRRLARPTAALGAVGLGLVLGPLLAAVQLVPGVEIARASIRSAPISLTEMS